LHQRISIIRDKYEVCYAAEEKMNGGRWGDMRKTKGGMAVESGLEREKQASVLSASNKIEKNNPPPIVTTVQP
jgi:hypothetical protein